MSTIIDWIKREPAVLTQVVGAIISLAASFGFSLDKAQTAAVMGVVALVAGFITRARVTPTTDPGPKHAADN